ncbi:TetR/AcrR family transcriptional regulator [Streptomonospora sp. PA3]|uniref:TetR family transcriptional regulator n=1 Tax=Streptomonospora sp. PA3 TaxID=2607326 RepID=UPI0012DC16BC|nr:TetR family transcriptional regulator [Streptomonospora sp. PA3]MUL42740.1 TetR/AcrR family transcriptional regulator [Streptomonospora sp. PA3]
MRSRSQNQRRKRIVQTAAALALRGGVEAMQMRTVAERAGVALGTLYRYFPSKMDLVVAVVAEELDLLEASIDRRPPTAETAAGRAVDVLMRATRGLMREPELADALVRSLIMTEANTELGARITDLLWRVAHRSPDAEGEGPESGVPEPPDRADPAYIRVASLASVWIFELLEVLKGARDVDEVQHRLEIAAEPLLADR